jgi:WD40 repeat protein
MSVTGPDWSRKNIIVFNNIASVADPHTDVTSGSVSLWTVSMSGDRKPTIFLRSKQSESNGVFSPDGSWIAYNSNASGTYQVYVRPFPGKDPSFLVSRDGGRYPRWRGDGKELFFLAEDGTMMAAPIDTTRGFAPGVPQALFRTPLWWSNNNRPYAVTKDGRRFLILIPPAQPLRVVMDWRAMLAR